MAGGAAGQRPGQQQREAQHDGTRARTPAASQLHWCPSPKDPPSPDRRRTPSVPCLVKRGEGAPPPVRRARATHPRGRRGRTAGMPATETDLRPPPRAPRRVVRGVAGGRWSRGAARRRGRGRRLGGARRAAERGHLPAAGGRQPGRRRDAATSQGVRDRDLRGQGQAGAHHRGHRHGRAARGAARRPRGPPSPAGVRRLPAAERGRDGGRPHRPRRDRRCRGCGCSPPWPSWWSRPARSSCCCGPFARQRVRPARGRARALHPRVATGPQRPPPGPRAPRAPRAARPGRGPEGRDRRGRQAAPAGRRPAARARRGRRPARLVRPARLPGGRRRRERRRRGRWRRPAGLRGVGGRRRARRHHAPEARAASPGLASGATPRREGHLAVHHPELDLLPRRHRAERARRPDRGLHAPHPRHGGQGDRADLRGPPQAPDDRAPHHAHLRLEPGRRLVPRQRDVARHPDPRPARGGRRQGRRRRREVDQRGQHDHRHPAAGA